MHEKIKGQWQIDDEEYVSCQKLVDCPDSDKADLCKRAMSYFADNFSDVNSVILERDAVNGIIIGKGVFKKVHVLKSLLRNSTVDTRHILKVEVRDGRAKVTLFISFTTRVKQN